MPQLYKPTPAELASAGDRVVPDVIAPGLRVLFCGINPGLYSAAVGHHFARPGNRFWPALFAGGFTPRLLSPFEDAELPRWGCGITNLVERASASADELSADELAAGGRRLERKVRCFGPTWVAFCGIGAYRTAFGRKKARTGRQEESLAGAAVWILPNPSGLNAHYRAAELGELFAALHRAVFAE